MTPSELALFNSRKPFDPFAYAAEMKEHPERFVSLQKIYEDAKTLNGIRKAPDLATLKERFEAAYRTARETGDDVLMELMKQHKDTRKKEVTK
ncbi:MAG: hypothetical protein KGL39_56055 [Patescibacteria group bacterium]|nr:hypothetical protein [Patescibacteria group bacterium]